MDVDITHSRSGAIMIGVAIFILFYMARMTLKVIESIPLQYYNMLPIATDADFDYDGIPNRYDDIDQDGIDDQNDPYPYGIKANFDNPIYRRLRPRSIDLQELYN